MLLFKQTKLFMSVVGIIFLGILVIPKSALAGCSNYVGTNKNVSEPAPRVEICFKGKCELTIQEFNCSNHSEAVMAYNNGLTITATRKGGMLVVWNGKVIPKNQWRLLSCEELDQGMDSCFDFR